MTISSFPPLFQLQNSDQQRCHGRVKIPDKSYFSDMLYLYLNNSNCTTLDMGAWKRIARDGRWGDILVKIIVPITEGEKMSEEIHHRGDRVGRDKAP